MRLRYEHLGDPGPNDLEKAISAEEESVRITPDDNNFKRVCLCALGSSLLLRFNRLGKKSDIDKAVNLSEKALKLTLDGHRDKQINLNHLVMALQARFKRLGCLDDLDRAVLLHREAVRLTSHVILENMLTCPIWAALCAPDLSKQETYMI
jgi:hypothetical protein